MKHISSKAHRKQQNLLEEGAGSDLMSQLSWFLQKEWRSLWSKELGSMWWVTGRFRGRVERSGDHRRPEPSYTPYHAARSHWCDH